MDNFINDQNARKLPLAGKGYGNGQVLVEMAPPATRIAVRVSEHGLAALSKAFGLELPNQPLKLNRNDTRMAAWLGPDEWLVIDEGQNDLSALCQSVEEPCSLVDVSHRNCAILVSGAGSEIALNCGSALDLSLEAFAINCAKRTILGRAEIVLIRLSEHQWRVECWRSFAPYVFALLEYGGRDV